jgi:hypothetical protein
LQQAVHACELTLAQTRLKLLESETSAQSLERQNHSLRSDLEEERKRINPLKWFKKS